MALTSIHVQYNRYTVTESNTSIKEQKIGTQREEPTISKQPSCLQLSDCLQHTSTTEHRRFKVFIIIHIDLHYLDEEDLKRTGEPKKNGEKDQK